jgi:competence protein ComEC
MDQLFCKMSKKTSAFFSSLFLGYKKVDEREMSLLKEHFKWWGISHYLARSGLHMVIFSFVLHLFLRVIPITFLYKQIILLVLSLLYFFLSFPSVSFNRAFLTFLLFKMCILTQQQTHPLHLFTLTTFIILLINPWQLFFLDFQLSFGLTFALIWLNHLKSKQKLIPPINY